MTIKGDLTLVFIDTFDGKAYEMPSEDLTDVFMCVTKTGKVCYRIGFLNNEFEVCKEDYDWCVDYLNRKANGQCAGSKND